MEIDGELTGIGRALFNRRLTMIRPTRGRFFARPGRRFDANFVDAYRQPYIRSTLRGEFFELARSRLIPGGVLLVDVGHLEGSAALESVLGSTVEGSSRMSCGIRRTRRTRC